MTPVTPICAICLENLSVGQGAACTAFMQCGHVICTDCARRQLGRSGPRSVRHRCPICRQAPLTSTSSPYHHKYALQLFFTLPPDNRSVMAASVMAPLATSAGTVAPASSTNVGARPGINVGASTSAAALAADGAMAGSAAASSATPPASSATPPATPFVLLKAKEGAPPAAESPVSGAVGTGPSPPTTHRERVLIQELRCQHMVTEQLLSDVSRERRHRESAEDDLADSRRRVRHLERRIRRMRSALNSSNSSSDTESD